MIVEVAAVVVLGLFALWGGFRGVWRQVFGLVLVLGALWIAGRFSARLEGLVAKVYTLEAHDRCLAAWAVAFLGAFVVASVLVRFLSRMGGGLRLPGFSVLGALVGLVKGALVVVIAVYAVLVYWDEEPRPAVATDVESSATARWTVRAATELRRLVPVPGCLGLEIDDVDVRVGR